MKFIGEIGCNHDGDIKKAIDIIYMAKEVGVDIVKFQKRSPKDCVPLEVQSTTKQWKGKILSYLEYRNEVEFGEEEYDLINETCKSIGIEWTVSVWDVQSVRFMEKYMKDIPFIKIPSACITDIELIYELNKYDIPVIISDGMSTEEEIYNAIYSIKNLYGIFHTTSSYPTQIDEIDLNVIKTYRKEFPQLVIGYSGHEPTSLEFPTLIAHSLGVDYIERHIMISDDIENSDKNISLNREQLETLLFDLEGINTIMGRHRPHFYESEQSSKDKLRYI